MKNFFIAIQIILLFSLSLLFSLDNNAYLSNLFSVKNTFAATDQPNFQNTSPWFVSWWNKVSTEAQNVIQWFQQKTQNVLSGGQKTPISQAPLNQYPSLSGQNISQQSSFPIQQQSPSGSGSSGGGNENGTSGSPYKLEPNQFKKDCGQNTYILYWRKGGEKGKDMAQPVEQGPGAGKDQAQIVYWILPTCEELSKCHCCCNTCTFPEGEICPQGWCFSKNTICDDKKECSNKCSDKCDEKCKKGCEDYQEPTHKKAFNRDCKCASNGCPSESSNGCKIMIKDPGQSQIEYTDAQDKTWKETPAGSPGAYFENGWGKDDKQSRLRVGANDTKENGYVKKLKNEKGKCCKCYQDGPPIQ